MIWTGMDVSRQAGKPANLGEIVQSIRTFLQKQGCLSVTYLSLIFLGNEKRPGCPVRVCHCPISGQWMSMPKDWSSGLQHQFRDIARDKENLKRKWKEIMR